MIEIRLESDCCLTGCGPVPTHRRKNMAASGSSERVRIVCINTVAITILQNARSRDRFLLQWAREIWLLSAIHKFEIIAQHVPGQLMTHADALSWAHLNPSLMTKISVSTHRRVSLKPDASDVNYNEI